MATTMRLSFMERIRRDERGVAMITALLVTGVLTALGLTVTQVALSNMTNAGRDRVAGGALGAAEAGVTRAVAWVNQHSPSALACYPTCSFGWGNPTTPQVVSLPDGRTAKVYITPVVAYAPPTYKTGTYQITSIGNAGSGPGQRTLNVTVQVRPMQFPLGIFTQNKIDNGGTGAVYSESVLSDACIDNRNHMTFTGIDAYYGIPAAAHSTKYVTEANIGSAGCDSNLNHAWTTDNKAIHRQSVGTCSSTYPYDQDTSPLGGTFAGGSACSSAADQYTASSYFDSTMLRADPYNYIPRGLTDAQYALLKARAMSQGTYYTTTSPASWPSPTAQSNPVIYFKLNPGDTVSLQGELNAYAWANDPSCVLNHPTVVLVVEGGSLKLNSNASITGAIFVPDGDMTYNGGAQLVGTVFTKQLHMTGNAQITLNDCYTKSTPGGIIEIKPIRWREVDR